MIAALTITFFAICPLDNRMCEEGHVIARTCAQAEHYIRAGLRHDQEAHITECREERQASR